MLCAGAVGGLLLTLLSPVSASGVSRQLVTILGANGKSVFSDASHRLQTTETDPRNLIRLVSLNVGACGVLYQVPLGKGLVVKSATFLDPGYANNTTLSVYTSPDCSGAPLMQGSLYVGSYGGVPTVSVEAGAGALVPAGSTLTVASNNGGGDHVLVYGYLVTG